MSRLSLVAAVALTIPFALVVMGLQEHAPASAEAKVVRPTKVVRVTKVVNVKRVVQRAPVSGQAITTTPAPSPAPAAASPAPTRSAPEPTAKKVGGRTAPVQREGDANQQEPEPTEESAESCVGDACGSTVSPAPAPSF
jgi:hypothetical protein